MYSTSGYNGSVCSLRGQAGLCHFGFVTALLKFIFHILKMAEKMKLICINFLAHNKGLKNVHCYYLSSIHLFIRSVTIYLSILLPPSFLPSSFPSFLLSMFPLIPNFLLSLSSYLPSFPPSFHVLISPSIHPSIHHPLLHASLAWCSMPDCGDYKNKEDITPDSVEIPV